MPPEVLFPRRTRDLARTAGADQALILGAGLAILAALVRGLLDPSGIGLAVAVILLLLGMVTLGVLRRRVARDAPTYLVTAILGTAMLFTADIGGVVAGFVALIGATWGYLERAG